MRRYTPRSVEILEDRIAPASLFTYHPNSIKYTDVDGDLVTVSFSKSFITSSNVNSIFTITAASTGVPNSAILQSIDLTQAATFSKLAGMKISISVKKEKGGDGRVDVGVINAPGIDLGSISVQGNLAGIDVGNNNASENAVRSLATDGLGLATGQAQPLGGSAASTFDGALPKLSVNGNANAAAITVEGAIGSVVIKGNLDGSALPGTMGAGSLMAGGNIGVVEISGNVVGNSAQSSGAIASIQGSLGVVEIGGALDGSAGTSGFSGYVSSAGGIKEVSVGGNVLSAAGYESGVITAKGTIAAVKIGGSLEGSYGNFAGEVQAGREITAMSVGGNLAGGATIRAGAEIGALAVKGGIEGTAGAPIVISAQGMLNGSKSDVAIGSLSVASDMTYAVVLAGYDTSLNPQDPNAQIGTVTVGGNYIASDIVAGVVGTMNGGNFEFGTAADSAITQGNVAAIIGSKISSVTIGGNVMGDSVSGDTFGITAQYVQAVKIGAALQGLQAGGNNDTFAAGKEISLAANVVIDEVPPPS